MSEESPPREVADVPDAVAKPRRPYTVQLVWIVPLIALIVGATLAVRALIERGHTITITFKSGEGLEADKTKIKYKEVEIGEVENVALSEDHSHVIVTARLRREEKGLLAKDTRFWVVRPRISGGYVSGLGTLMGGSYIGVDAGRSNEQSRTFKGLEVPPAVTSDVRGSTFFLRASDLGSLNITSPIFFRRFQVGQVTAMDLDRDGRGVTFTIFINSPYDRYISENTVFWHASGVDISLSAGGVEVNTESIVSILLGGVAFEPPEEKLEGPLAAPGSSFRLYANRKDAMRHAEPAQQFLLRFRQSVRGLAVDAPVELGGVTVGEVSAVNLRYDRSRKNFYAAVEIHIHPDRLLQSGTASKDSRAFIDELVGLGLRARLGSTNIVTGQRYVALEFDRKAQNAKIDWSRTRPDFPTTSRGELELQESLARIARKIEKLPLEEIAAEVRRSVASLDQALRRADAMIKGVNTEVLPEARAVLDEARKTLGEGREALSSDAPLRSDLRETLHELSRAATSVRILTDYLEQHPESLIRGKKGDKVP